MSGSGLMDPVRLLPFLLAPFEGRGFHVAEVSGEARWIAVEDTGALIRLMTGPAAFQDDLRLRTVPYRFERDWVRFMNGSCLWARIESGESARLLEAFTPPTIVLREGATVKRTALWALDKGLRPDDVERANRRISLALQTSAASCEPGFSFPPPGTILRKGRGRPVSVVVESQTDELYPVSMTRHLKDRPKADPSKWRRPGGVSPIRPENAQRYGQAWDALALSLKFCADYRCECDGRCGRPAAHLAEDGRCRNVHGQPAHGTGSKVVLTIAHLDHRPENNDRSNLMVACQGCHLHYDRAHHAQTRAGRLERAGQLTLG